MSCHRGGRRKTVASVLGSTATPASGRASDRLIAGVGLCLVAAVLGATTAPASEGIYLSWNDCWSAPDARSDLENVCLGSDGGQSLFCAFTLPEAMDSVVAVEVVVNIQLASGSLPAWWQLAPGGCRFGALHSSAYLPRSSTCVDFWRGEAAGPSQEYLVGVPHLGNQAQIHVAFSVPSNTPRSLDATDVYFAARIDIGDDS